MTIRTGWLVNTVKNSVKGENVHNTQGSTSTCVAWQQHDITNAIFALLVQVTLNITNFHWVAFQMQKFESRGSFTHWLCNFKQSNSCGHKGVVTRHLNSNHMHANVGEVLHFVAFKSPTLGNMILWICMVKTCYVTARPVSWLQGTQTLKLQVCSRYLYAYLYITC